LARVEGQDKSIQTEWSSIVDLVWRSIRVNYSRRSCQVNLEWRSCRVNLDQRLSWVDPNWRSNRVNWN